MAVIHRRPAGEGLEEFFVRHYPQLVGWARQLVGADPSAAEDLVQDTFVRLALRQPDLGAIANLEGYLFITMRNVHLSEVRRHEIRRLEVTSLLDYESLMESLAASATERHRQTAYEELVLIAQYASIRKTTSKAASALILRFFHGYYPAEIARVLQTNDAAVDARLRIARAEAHAFVTEIDETLYTFPALVVGPRFGVAYDVTGTQRFVVRGGAGTYFDRPRPGNATSLIRNKIEQVTVRYSELQNLAGGLTTTGARALIPFEYNAKLPTAAEWNAGIQTMLRWATSLDVAYTGRHNYNAEQTTEINTIDLGTGFVPSLQDPSLAPRVIPGAISLAAQNPNLVRGYRGYGPITYLEYGGWRTFHSIELGVNRRFRDGVQFGFSDTIVLSDVAKVLPRYDHGSDGQIVRRADQAQAQALLGDQTSPTHNLKATFVWQLPRTPSTDNTLTRVVGLIANDWQLSGIWTGTSASAYQVTQQYQTGNANVNLTGSPDFAPRILVVGEPGKGCSRDVYRQFNTAAFQGPPVGSVGLESGNDYLRGCFLSVLDLAIARNIRLGGSRTLQLRVDMFNAFNRAGITSRNTTLQLSSPADPVTPLNLPFDANGNVLPNRVRPNQAGFGAVSGYQAPRTIQAYLRFGF